MDNVTHTLFALTLARTPLGRGGAATTTALVLASNAPDIDIVAAYAGSANYLTWHRGPTHGPMGVVGLGLVIAASVWLFSSWGRPIRLTASAKASALKKPDPTKFSPLLVVSIVGVLAHILMDLPTSYGTRLLSPFSWRWFAMDLMPIIDVYLWIVLAAGLFVGRRSRRAGQWTAAIVLALMAANYGIRAAAHSQALAAAAERFGPELPVPCDPAAAFGGLLDSWPQTEALRAGGTDCLMDTAAIPSFGSPFEWRILARLPDGYREIYGNDSAWIPNQWTPLVAKAAQTPSVQALLGFSRTPAAREFPEPSGSTTVQFTDLRFTMGPAIRQLQARRDSFFTATVRFGPNNEILEERLGQ